MKPFYKKWWFWLIIVVVVIAIIGAVAGTLGGKNDEGENSDKTEQYNYIGDTVTSASMNFTVNNVSNMTLLGSEYVGVSTENNFIVIELTIKNTGKSEVNLTSSCFELTKGSSKYEIHTGSIYLDNGFYAIESIGSDIVKKIVIVFETPSKSTEEIYTLAVKGSSLSKAANIVLSTK